MNTAPKDPLQLLERGSVELITSEELKKKLQTGQSLRIKLGVDPTSPELHLGHTVPLSKLRTFQDLGHQAVLIIGDFTAQVGDPSGQDKTRPVLTYEEIEQNAKTYQKQAFKILNPDKTEVRFNSEWLAPIFRVERAIPQGSVLQTFLTRYSVFRLLEREEFSKRRKTELPLTIAEILYPLLQGYDSVAVRADVELGGNDQLFNLLMGRQLQKDFDQPPQIALTLPLLLGTEGTRKMSKSYGNHIALEDPPKDMFGKIMSLSDPVMWQYYELLTTENVADFKKKHPKDAKLHLAEILTSRFHGSEAAENARMEFEKIFTQKEPPNAIASYTTQKNQTLVEVLTAAQLAPSRNEARRLLSQGAVKLGGRKITQDQPLSLSAETLLQVGTRRFTRLLPPSQG
ncbi:MAG: tyrosine--tRNA ligase [Elusimicrobia bacterium]|nr:tyrosine--tRNA ligase [Elusimicrobiota bacterium]